jgi:hypothetical protein
VDHRINYGVKVDPHTLRRRHRQLCQGSSPTSNPMK